MYNAALKVLNILYENGFESYIVGGYPRDLYMGISSLDIDICSNATPMDIKRLFPSFRILNETYGAVIVNVDNYSFEVTTFREEITYQNNRIPSEFNYVKTLEEDIVRRDFTVNTICIDRNGDIIDLLDGKNDIDNKIIRCVGSADKKFTEDALRMLRAIRFATTLNFKLDDEIIESIKKNKHLLKNLSYYRKKQELNRIFMSNNAEYGIKLINELDVAKELDIDTSSVVITSSGIGIWAQVKAIDHYEFSNIEKSDIIKINDALNDFSIFVLYRYGLYIGGLAFEIKGYTKEDISSIYGDLGIYRRSDIAVKATDICNALGRTPGAFLKEIFEDIERKIVFKELNNDKEELIGYIINRY